MELLQPGKNNDDDVKKGRLEADAEIYNSKRLDPTASERWKMMTPAEKRQYFKEYYLKFTIIGLIVLAISSYIIYTIVKPDKPDVFYAALFNVYLDVDSEDNFQDDFGSYLGNKVDTHRIFLKSYYDSYISEMEVDNFFERRRFDVFITNTDRFKTYSKADNYMNLEEALPKDLYDKLSDKLVYCNDLKSKNPTEQSPYGISLKDCKYKFYDEYENVIEDPVIGIVINTQRKDTAIKFIKYLFE